MAFFFNFFNNDDDNVIEKGSVSLNKIELTKDNIEVYINDFISIDTETTGFKCDSDKIIEIGACIFKNGEKINEFGTLIKSVTSIPSSATKANNITIDMLENAPNEKEAYEDFYNFIGDALKNGTVFVAHNASFDFGFLKRALEGLGYNCSFSYIDTLSLARHILPALKNHKQNTILEHYNILNRNAHRAKEDAEACGKMFIYLCDDGKSMFENNNGFRISSSSSKRNKEHNGMNYYHVNKEAISPNEEERELCAVVKKLLIDNCKNTDNIYFYRNSNGVVDVRNGWFSILQFKVTKKYKYIVIRDKYVIPNYQIEPSSKKEGEKNVRMIFENPDVFIDLSEYIMRKFKESEKINATYPEYNMDSDFAINTLNEYDLDSLVNSAYCRYNNYTKKQQEEKLICESLELEKQKKEELKQQTIIEKQLIRERKIEKAKAYAEKFGIEYNKSIINHGKRAIYQMDDDGNIINTFKSLSEAIKQTGVNSKSIRDVTNGKQKHAGGFVWRYVDQIKK